MGQQMDGPTDGQSSVLSRVTCNLKNIQNDHVRINRVIQEDKSDQQMDQQMDGPTDGQSPVLSRVASD